MRHFGSFADGRQPRLNRELGEFRRVAIESRVGTLGAGLTHGCVRTRIDLGLRGLKDRQVEPDLRCHLAYFLLAGCRPGARGVAKRAATRRAAGTASCNRSSRFPSSSTANIAMPVILPPGWARLAAQPYRTGSGPSITSGTVRVASWAARAASWPAAIIAHVTVDPAGGEGDVQAKEGGEDDPRQKEAEDHGAPGNSSMG